MILYGASGHARVIAEIILATGTGDIEFWDNAVKPDIWGYKVLKPADHDGAANRELIISIGNNRVRRNIADKLSGNFVFANAIHPSAIVSQHAVVAAGTVIMANVSVNCDTRIGEHVILNTNCSVDHDCIIDDFVHVSPNAALAGNVEVGEGTHIGIGACVIQGIKIGKWATIGAGAVIITDVPDCAVVVGNPGRIIKYNQPAN